MVELNEPRMQDLDENEQHREVYARFGLAVYFAQVFEVAAANLIVVQDLAENRLRSQAEVDERFEQLFRTVLGRHVHALSARLDDDDDMELCRTALAERNRLIHHYWRVEIEKVTTEAGRQQMVDDLARVRDLFIRADAALDRLLYTVGEHLGFTPAAVQAELQRRRARPPAG